MLIIDYQSMLDLSIFNCIMHFKFFENEQFSMQPDIYCKHGLKMFIFAQIPTKILCVFLLFWNKGWSC